MRIRLSAALATAALLFLAPTGRAQTATGQVNGAVTDNTEAAVPNAVVKLTNQATGIETVRSTNESGWYVFINVPPGRYALRVSNPGFKQAEVSPLIVGVSQDVTANVRLNVGPVVETVEVTADSTSVPWSRQWR